MYDIFYVSKNEGNDQDWSNIKSRYPTAQRLQNIKTFQELKSKAFTKMFWAIWDDLDLHQEFALLDYRATKWDDTYVHVFKNGEFFDGICLFPKSLDISQREFDNRFFIEKKQVDIQASSPKPYRSFTISNYEEYLKSAEETDTEMFWAIWPDIEIVENFKFDYRIPYYDSFHKNITHVFKNGDHFDGVCLFSKKTLVSKKEIEYRFFTEKKQVDIISSHPVPYDKFIIDNFNDYVSAKNESNSTLFWCIPKEVEIVKDFDFSFYTPERNFNHVFKHKFRNQDTYNGVMLLSKNNPLSAKEINFRFLIEKKQHDILASKLKPYDIIFISYNETNADENYKSLKSRFPEAKRIHGVKGIHNAHIEAAKIAESHMFWVVDGDALVDENFSFDYEVSRYELDIVHVWRSKNPINDLVYGYGGIKLLPRDLTLNINVNSADMTTSISKRFKAMPEVSNLTVFNTDPFNTWKSAFRECVKLSSKTIEGQIDKETEERLSVWCSVGKDNLFGEYAISGAIEGRKYGEDNRENPDNLKKINDFDWLKTQFDRIYG